MFGRTTSPEKTIAKAELKAAKRALANDPVNTGEAGTVDIDSPEGRANLTVQARVSAAERHYKSL